MLQLMTSSHDFEPTKIFLSITNKADYVPLLPLSSVWPPIFLALISTCPRVAQVLVPLCLPWHPFPSDLYAITCPNDFLFHMFESEYIKFSSIFKEMRKICNMRGIYWQAFFENMKKTCRLKANFLKYFLYNILFLFSLG